MGTDFFGRRSSKVLSSAELSPANRSVGFSRTQGGLRSWEEYGRMQPRAGLVMGLGNGA